MTQENKDLLLKDLCGRLPYGVKVEAKGLLKTIMDDYDNRDIINAYVLNGLNLRDCFKTYSIDCIEKVPLFDRKGVCNIKPYLFPMTSMTEEQSKIYHELIGGMFGTSALINIEEFVDWCNKNHFDFRGLIPKGLALDATNLNIY